MVGKGGVGIGVGSESRGGHRMWRTDREGGSFGLNGRGTKKRFLWMRRAGGELTVFL